MDIIAGLPTREDFENKILWSELDWLIDRDPHQVVIDPKYADGISFISTDKTKMNRVKRLAPHLLKKKNLSGNESNREELRIPDE